MMQEQPQTGNRRPPAYGIDTRAEWRSCGLYALVLLVMMFLPLSATAAYLTRQRQPAGTILSSAMFLLFALAGLALVIYLWPKLRTVARSLRFWYASLSLFLCGVVYDSLAHIWWRGPLPTFDQLLPNGSAGIVRQAICFAGLVWSIVALHIIPMVRDARQRRLSTPPPSAQ